MQADMFDAHDAGPHRRQRIFQLRPRFLHGRAAREAGLVASFLWVGVAFDHFRLHRNRRAGGLGLVGGSEVFLARRSAAGRRSPARRSGWYAAVLARKPENTSSRMECFFRYLGSSRSGNLAIFAAIRRPQHRIRQTKISRPPPK